MEPEEKILSLSMKYSAVLITAPRQVGKTTILRQLMQETRTYVTLDDLEKRAIAQKILCFLKFSDYLVPSGNSFPCPEIICNIKLKNSISFFGSQVKTIEYPDVFGYAISMDREAKV